LEFTISKLNGVGVSGGSWKVLYQLIVGPEPAISGGGPSVQHTLDENAEIDDSAIWKRKTSRLLLILVSRLISQIFSPKKLG
jgi:hypothetical protein